MSETVIAREAAEEMIKLWCDELDTDNQPQEVFVKAVMQGRVDFDESDEVFTVTLKKPIAQENGEYITSIKISEPTAGQIQESSKGTKDDFVMTIRLLSKVSGKPVGIIDRLKKRDLEVLGEAFGFFS